MAHFLITEFNLFTGKVIKDRMVNEVTTLHFISKINLRSHCRFGAVIAAEGRMFGDKLALSCLFKYLVICNSNERHYSW